MSSSNKKASFDKIQTEWYKRLKDSGFDDLEYKDGSIRSGVPRSAISADPIRTQATQEYYYMAYHFLNEYEFESELEKVIWEYHTNGLSVRDIAKALKSANVTKFGRDKCWNTIRRLETIMKIKYLSP